MLDPYPPISPLPLSVRERRRAVLGHVDDDRNEAAEDHSIAVDQEAVLQREAAVRQREDSWRFATARP
jgi:hypothetical protein